MWSAGVDGNFCWKRLGIGDTVQSFTDAAAER